MERKFAMSKKAVNGCSDCNGTGVKKCYICTEGGSPTDSQRPADCNGSCEVACGCVKTMLPMSIPKEPRSHHAV